MSHCREWSFQSDIVSIWEKNQMGENKAPGKGNWKEHYAGIGNWALMNKALLEQAFMAAGEWAAAISTVEKPWLCWCVSDEWSVLQQKLIIKYGWTPVVGHDTNIESPVVIDGSIYIDFNKHFKFPKMYMHFPLEFAFLFCDKLAFWHSDMVMSYRDMEKCVALFETLEDGCMSAVKERESLRRFWRIPGSRRFFEVAGCTTRGASKSQYEHGCGWWRNYHMHPNFKSDGKPVAPGADHGFGIWYWYKHFERCVKPLKVSMEGHAAAYKTRFIRSKAEDMERFFSLRDIAKRLDIADLLP